MKANLVSINDQFPLTGVALTTSRRGKRRFPLKSTSTLQDTVARLGRSRFLVVLGASLLAVALPIAPVIASTSYNIVVLPAALPGWNEARAINNHNQIAGESGSAMVALWDGSGVHSRGSGYVFDINEAGQMAGQIGNRAYYWDEFGVAHVLTTLPGRLDSARTLNNRGVIAGFTELYPHEYGSIWDQNGWHQLPEYGSFSSIHSINDNGVGSGFSDGSHPLRWTGTQWETLPSLGGYGSIGGINQAGVIVGESDGRAVYWDTSDIHIIGQLPGWERTYATSINNQGVVVGGTVFSGSYGRAWVWDGSSMQSLEPLPGDQFSEANDINDNGWIVGMSGGYGGDPRAVVWIPVPEPSALALLGLGAAAVLISRRRQ